MFKKQLLILLLIFWTQNSSCFIEDLFAVVKNGWKLAQFLNDIKSTKDTQTDIVSLLTNADDHQEIIGKLDDINHKLDHLKSYITDKQNYITLLIEQLPSELEIQSKKDRLVSFILAANRLWDELISYIRRNGTEKMFNDLADDILDKLKLELQEFRQILTPLPGTITPAEHGLFILLVDNADKKRDILCNRNETSHHGVVRLFHIVITTEIKAHTLLFVAHLLKYSKNDGWKVPLETQFKEQFNRCFDTFSRSLKIARLPYMRSCDPDVWRIDDNYYGLHGYLQNTIYYHLDCIPQISPDCSDLNRGEATKISASGRRCSMIPLNNHAKCDGKPFGCELMESVFTDLITCAWEEGPYRIRFVKHKSKTYGTDKASVDLVAKDSTLLCPPGNDYTKLWYQRLGDRERACSCQCPESRVKLMTQLISSRTDDNYVIVGLRIHRVQDYIYIQIAEGKLEANGYISNYSWVPSTRETKPRWGFNSEIEVMRRDKDVFFLGDVQLPPGYVLTGIQFAWRWTEEVIGHAVLICGNYFDYSTGKLIENPEFVGEKKRTHKWVERGNDHELKFPTKTPINMKGHERSTPKSDGYTHVKLQRSDLSDDYGQTTLPLLDGVPILTNPLSPIGGVGLFYKGYAEDYAGFLSLRMYPINFTYFMESFKKTHDVNLLLN